MENLTTFTNEVFGNIRGVEINGEPWLVGKDVAEALGYADPRSTVSKKVDKEDRGVAKMETPSGVQNMTIINESGFYSLVLGSKLPEAKKFKRWVTSEVLPQIRKTGGYIPVNEEDDEKTIMAKALQIMDRTIKMMDRTIERQDTKIHELEGDVYKLEGLAIKGYSLKDLSTCLGYKERFLDDYCISQGWYSRVNHDVLIKDNRYVKRLKKNSINFTDLGRETLIEKFRDSSNKLF